ncbi:MAG TPA: S1 RNA-binding domain-containing protein [Candidatus Lachnoclostridium stercoripullorum]|uniref:S1 RNA-binding domain-containing protein n=1 Tax=Candidatus Lachnoclostridium stercoripullorum TaxID=2838635 RepID=A0A9D1W4P2_9FIRM|nr:S1 RNA-binding domain-containing protein [Candidatus Lachnoclostridium stercoripullorum]
MSEEMKKDVMETAEAVETAAPAETMDDYAAELEESYKTLEGKQPVYEAEEDPAAEKWQNFAQMMEDKTVFDVKVKEAVKGGLVAFVDDVRAFIPASHISTHYVEKLEDMVGKHLDVMVITADLEKKRLVLSGREVEKARRDEARKQKLAQYHVGDVVTGKVESLQPYGAFVELEDGISGLVHVSQISTQRIKHPSVVLKEGQEVKAKVISTENGKIGLSMKALVSEQTEREEHEVFNYKETGSVSTGLGELLKNIKL